MKILGKFYFKVIRLTLCLVALLSALELSAQEQILPKTASGKPDFQGVWTNKTLTPLSRPSEYGDSLLLSEQAVERMISANESYLVAEYASSDPNREAGAGAQAGDDGDTNDGYNEFWKDVGTDILRIDGQYRSSILIEPKNGQIPYLGDPRARFRRAPGTPGPYDGPEGRPLAERCLLSFGSHSGPPMLPVMYNNNYQFVQTDDYLMILAEMAHDARIIRIGDATHQEYLQKWMGDSIAYWEGDTLVAVTKGFNSQQNFRGASENLTVTEYFSQTPDGSILYRFTVEDPETFSEPFTGELLFNSRAKQESMYEYACHEGNYALAGILAGARRLEQQEADQ